PAVLTVNKANQTITFGSLSDKTYGDASFNLGATSDSGLSVSYSVVSGNAYASVTGNTVTITGAGPVTIEATQTGDSDYNAATPVQQSFTINKASLTVSAVHAYKNYGESNPSFSPTYSGFAYGEVFGTSGVTGTPGLSSTADETTSPGDYFI